MTASKALEPHDDGGSARWAEELLLKKKVHGGYRIAVSASSSTSGNSAKGTNSAVFGVPVDKVVHVTKGLVAMGYLKLTAARDRLQSAKAASPTMLYNDVDVSGCDFAMSADTSKLIIRGLGAGAKGREKALRIADQIVRDAGVKIDCIPWWVGQKNAIKLKFYWPRTSDSRGWFNYPTASERTEIQCIKQWVKMQIEKYTSGPYSKTQADRCQRDNIEVGKAPGGRMEKAVQHMVGTIQVNIGSFYGNAFFANFRIKPYPREEPLKCYVFARLHLSEGEDSGDCGSAVRCQEEGIYAGHQARRLR